MLISTYLTYSNITEKSNDGYIEYSYTNQDNGYLDKDPFVHASYKLIASNPRKLFGKLDLERGQLLSTKYYMEDKFLQKKVSNEYNDDPSRYNSYVRSVGDITESYTCLGYAKASIPIYTFYSYMKKQTTEEYFRNGTSNSNTISYTYDPNSNLLRTTSTINSDGNEIKTRYKYPGDFGFVSLSQIAPTNEIHDIAQLQINNVVNVPMEINNSIIKNGVEYITGGKLNYFEDLKLEKTFELETNSHINITNFEFSTVRPSAGFLSDSRYKEKISFIKYDNKGNILEIRPTNGFSTSYIWAYNKTHPIAKLFNTTYNQIETLLGVTALNSLNISYDNAFIKSSTDQLRQGLHGAQVYSYLYNPNIGILSETPPNNNSTNFNYDIFGRLDYVTDHAGNIIKKNEYNYKKFKRISLSTNTLNFESVPFGTSKSKSIRVTNSSTLPFTISGLIIPSGYSYVINGSSVLLPGDYVDITITFSPTAASTYSGNITVLSDADGVNTIPVSGSGAITKIINISGNLDFVLFADTGCVFQNMTISNTGNTNLNITGINVGSPFAVNWTNGVIPPGQSKNVTVRFCSMGDRIYQSTINVLSDKTDGVSTIGTYAILME
ncbi:Ig-like domain-containing protein [Flavobacterium salmonis]|uniref:Uncharacterized protein n=1 Tax=Flavobacterium salmonis TaxID=2654844 RepID=A0A6V6YSM8_9FLAO|nr:choice-of-anchor D domain-containing protein [Flavobacterium salmonis]CAD0002416.1 hypothetical protein FLAT13_01122 [Flavobacterium salmonis]